MTVRKFALLLVSTAGLVLGSAAAYADEPTAAPTDAAQATNSADLDKMVCKSMDPPTGSRLGSRRECHTQREWDDRMRRAREQTEQQQNSGFHAGNPGH